MAADRLHAVVRLRRWQGLGPRMGALPLASRGHHSTARGPAHRPSADHLVRLEEDAGRQRQPESLRCLEVHHQLEPRRLLDGQPTGGGAGPIRDGRCGRTRRCRPRVDRGPSRPRRGGIPYATQGIVWKCRMLFQESWQRMYGLDGGKRPHETRETGPLASVSGQVSWGSATGGNAPRCGETKHQAVPACTILLRNAILWQRVSV